MEADSHRQVLTAKLQHELRESRERLITHPNLATEILDLGEDHVQKILRSSMTQNELILFDIALDEVHMYYEDQAIAYEIIMTIARASKSKNSG